jgi:hypothetical protein
MSSISVVHMDDMRAGLQGRPSSVHGLSQSPLRLVQSWCFLRRLGNPWEPQALDRHEQHNQIYESISGFRRGKYCTTCSKQTYSIHFFIVTIVF